MKKKLSEWNDTRQSLSNSYRQLLAKHCPSVLVPSAHHLMTVVLPEGIERQAIVDHLRNQGIQTTIPYQPVQITLYNDVASPRTEEFCRQLTRQLTLPLHPGMTLTDVVVVVNSLAAALDAESLVETIA